MYTKLLIPAALGAAVLFGGTSYAADAGNSNMDYLYLEYQRYPHAQPPLQPPAVSMDTASPATTPRPSFEWAPTAPTSRTVSIDGHQLAASAVVGSPVLTPSGERLGQVSRVAGLESANEIVISLDENRQMKVGSAEPAKLPGSKANAEPVIVGGPSAVVGADKIRRAGDGTSLVVEQSSLRPIDRKYG